MKRLIFSIFLSISAIVSLSAQQGMIQLTSDSLESGKYVTVQAADSAYIQGDYHTAISIYEDIIADQGESAVLYMNLGNAYFKIEETAKAILNYERALRLDPSDQDARFNLELARTRTVDKVTDSGEFFFVSWMRRLTHIFAVNEWAVTSIVLMVLASVAFCVFILGRSEGRKKIAFAFGIFFFAVCIITFIFATTEKNGLKRHDSAIIMTPSVTVKSTPSDNGTDLFVIHEGRKVKIKDSSMKEWVGIELDDGNTGWIPLSVIEVI